LNAAVAIGRVTRRRVIPNGASPQQTDAEAAAIAAAEANELQRGAEATASIAAADAEDDSMLDAEPVLTVVDDDEEDVGDEDAADEIDAEEEEGEDDEEEGEDEEDEGEDAEDFDDEDEDDEDENEDDAEQSSAERALRIAAIEAGADVQARMHALFQTGLESSVVSLPRLAERVRAVDELLRSEEAEAVMRLLRQCALQERQLHQLAEARRRERMLQNASFELGYLTRQGSTSGGSSNGDAGASAGAFDTVEALPVEQAHLVRVAYSGNKQSGDRSIRADCPFPTRLPEHAQHGVPFTAMCWVTRERFLQMQQQAEDDARKNAAATMPTKFVKATTLLASAAPSSSSSSSGSGGATTQRKRKKKGGVAAASSASVSSPTAAAGSSEDGEALHVRKTQRGEDSLKRDRSGDEAEQTHDADDDDAFPPLPILPQQDLPPGPFVPVVRLSLLAYFEVLIQAERPSSVAESTAAAGTGGSAASRAAARRGAQRALQALESCVAIGLGDARFRLMGKQPGWTSSSFGLHSDDGSIFHGSGQGADEYVEGGFGVGDIVGCGMDYTTGDVFFTKNGRHLGVAFHTGKEEGDEHACFGAGMPRTLYALIGLDATYDVTINFGDAFPFAFDVIEYERRTLGKLGCEDRTMLPALDDENEQQPQKMTDAATSSSAASSSSSSIAPAPSSPSTGAPTAANNLRRRYRAFQATKTRWAARQHTQKRLASSDDGGKEASSSSAANPKPNLRESECVVQ
jgi:hypothetical protein